MPGAGPDTKRVTAVNANWTADGGDGHFELLIVTEDDQRHTMTVTAQAMTSVLALTQATPVLLWDPRAGTLIAANLVGEWLPQGWSAGADQDDPTAVTDSRATADIPEQVDD